MQYWCKALLQQLQLTGMTHRCTQDYSIRRVQARRVNKGANQGAQDLGCLLLPVRLGPTLLSRLNAEAKDCCTCEDAGRDW